jgi:hypothetical protein
MDMQGIEQMTLQTAVTEWLSALPHVTSVKPVRVTIEGVTYAGARYTEQLTTPEGSDAYRRGERTYTREMIYLIGNLPRHYVKRSKAAYTMPGDSREWYIAGHWAGQHNQFNPNWETDKTKYHPFGPNFILAPWSVRAQAIRSRRSHD